jgi:carbonic anhydrase
MDNINQKIPASAVRSMELLVEGNDRFIGGTRSIESKFCSLKIKELAEKGQNPFAIVLTCSDSRVPVESIFDRGPGDLFVIRVAGNVISPDVIASIEYGASVLGSPLCLVMGHTGCGAVQAAVDYSISGKCPLPKHGKKLLKKIVPAVHDAARTSGLTEPKALARFTPFVNVQKNAEEILNKSRLMSDLVGSEKVTIVGAIYDLHTGRVCFDLEDRFNSIIRSEVRSQWTSMAYVG